MDDLKREIKNSHYRNDISISNSDNLEFIINITTEYSKELNLVSKILQTVDFIHNLDIENYQIIIENSFEVYSEKIFAVNFDNCIFNKSISYINCDFLSDVSFKDCEFKNKLDLNNSKFKENVRFHNSVFHETVNFQNTTFNKLVDFYLATFKNNQQFLLTDFLDRAIFSNVVFEKQIQFLYNRVNTTTMISFENTEFKSALDISRANFKCQLHFWNTKVNSNPDYYWLYYSDNISKEKLIPEIALRRMRETFRIIKNELKTSNNIINSLEFHKSEMEIYHKELKYSKKLNLNDKAILKFSKISNDYGTKWYKGLRFTLLSGAVFYCIFLLSISNDLSFNLTNKSIGQTVKHYFEFLNVTNWNFKPFGISNYGYAYAILFIGKIFIGYGYYQTIQAFRKYSRK